MSLARQQAVIRCQSADVLTAFERWLTAESAGDIWLVILEGAMLSGKSSLTKEPISLDERQTTCIGVDQFVRDDADNDQGYLDNVKRAPLAAAIQAGLATSPIVIVEGAMVWPLVQGIIEEVGSDRVRRVYLKRMKWSEPDRWHDGSQFIEAAAPRYLGEYSNSIDRYHRDHQPWRAADLVLERIEAEGEDDQ
jgi:hypothetical protein